VSHYHDRYPRAGGLYDPKTGRFAWQEPLIQSQLEEEKASRERRAQQAAIDLVDENRRLVSRVDHMLRTTEEVVRENRTLASQNRRLERRVAELERKVEESRVVDGVDMLLIEKLLRQIQRGQR
jgi:small-conductance mechanosensitive channel